MTLDPELIERMAAIQRGGQEKYHQKLRDEGKPFARERLARLLDPGTMVEEGLFARCADEGLPADAVVTVTGKIAGRPVCVMANDMTVKAGAWGRLTIQKIQRIQEIARDAELPMLYLYLDLYRLASEFFIDAIVPGRSLREDLCRRFETYASRPRRPVRRWNGVIPG